MTKLERETDGLMCPRFEPTAEWSPVNCLLEAVDSRGKIEGLFGFAWARWTEVFDEEELTERLTVCRRLPQEERVRNKTQYRMYFRPIRRMALALSTAYAFLNAEGLPRQRRRFTIELGAVNDGLVRKNNRAARLVDEGIDGVLKAMAKAEFDKGDFVATSSEDCQEGVRRLLDRIQTVPIREPLPLEVFHDFRQDVRRLVHLCHLVMPVDGRLLSVSQVLQELNRDLGKVHDGFVQRDLAGDDSVGEAMVQMTKGQIRDVKKTLRPFGLRWKRPDCPSKEQDDC